MIQPAIRIPFIICLIALLFVIPPAAAITLSPGNSFSSAPSIANGDPVYIRGIATGHPSNGLQVWLFGNNYMKISTISTNADNSYEYELKPSDTRALSPGQYFVLVQHPMMNGQFDIYYNSATGSVINRQLGTGTSIFQLTGSGSLQTPAGANALMNAIASQNLDDTFATASFVVNPPTAFIDPVGDRVVGEQFTVSGSTNIAVGDTLMVEITSSSFKPTSKTQSAEFSGASGSVTVVPGSGSLNRWSFPVDASTFKPDEYIVKVSGMTIDVTGSSYFNIVAARPVTPSTAITTVAVIATETSLPVVTAIPAPLPTTTKSPVPLMVIIGAIGLAACAAGLKRK